MLGGVLSVVLIWNHPFSPGGFLLENTLVGQPWLPWLPSHSVYSFSPVSPIKVNEDSGEVTGALGGKGPIAARSPMRPVFFSHRWTRLGKPLSIWKPSCLLLSVEWPQSQKAQPSRRTLCTQKP